MRRLVPAGLLLLLPLTACGGDGDDQTLTVLAAASLTGTFTELAEAFEEEHPGVDVELVLGSSTTLAEQVVDGAPGEVLATADDVTVEEYGPGVEVLMPDEVLKNHPSVPMIVVMGKD